MEEGKWPELQLQESLSERQKAVTFEAVSVKKIWKNDPVGASEP